MDKISLKSPNTLIIGQLIYQNEIRFGPPYYSLFIQDLGWLSGRFFGNLYLWSDDSNYLALQEWVTINEAEGPWTRLLLINFQTGLGSHVAGAKGGFIKPIMFEHEKIVYLKELQNTQNEFEVNIKSIDNWEQLDWAANP